MGDGGVGYGGVKYGGVGARWCGEWFVWGVMFGYGGALCGGVL